MAYTTPKTWATNDVVTAAEMNTYVRDNTAWLATDAPSCRVYHSANQSVANATFAALAFDSESHDVGGCHSTVTNTSRITVPSGASGKWLIGGSFYFDYHTTGQRIIALLVNGTTYIARHSHPASTGTTGGNTDLSIATFYALAAGDYVELIAYQASLTTLNVQRTSDYTPAFWAHWVRT